MTGPRQELAVSVSKFGEMELAGDDLLLAALSSGYAIKRAANMAGISERTVFRRLSDPDFRARLDKTREAIRCTFLTQVAEAGTEALSTLRELLRSDDPSIQLRAAKTLVDSFMSSEPKGTTQPSREGVRVLVVPDNGRDKRDRKI